MKTSFVQRPPGGKRFTAIAFPHHALAIEQFDFRGYDLVIPAAMPLRRGIITGPRQLHLCYRHFAHPLRVCKTSISRSRLDSDLGLAGALAAKHSIRVWDHRTAAGVRCLQRRTRASSPAASRRCIVARPTVGIRR